jgi:hypothetical protein
MRDLPWRYYFLAALAIGAVFGIQTLLRKYYPGMSGREVAMTLKPSHFRADSGTGMPADSAATRKPAAKGGYFDKESLGPRAPKVVEAEPAKKVERAETQPAGEQETYAASEDAKDTEVAARVPVPVATEAAAPAPAAATPATATAAKTEPAAVSGACEQVELRGDGPEITKVSKEDWAAVMKTFHAVKADLLGWLAKRRRELPERTAAVMEKQVSTLRIQRPPVAEEPDLAWRGIAVWTLDSAGEPMIRVGGGFVKLVVQQPARARFELARLVAQAWTPCELARVDAGAPWEPLLKCMGVNEQHACATGSYSEGGWAVSTVMARVVADPGCNIPVFADPSYAGCLKAVPLPRSVADHSDQGQAKRAVTGRSPAGAPSPFGAREETARMAVSYKEARR